MKKQLLLAGVIGALLVVGVGCATTGQTSTNSAANQTASTTPISIGWIGPLSGDAASVGEDALKASQLAVGEVNAAGGVNGRMLALDAEDGKCDGKTAANAATKLITLDRVPVIIGGTCSGETLAAAPVANQNKVVLFSQCSSAPSITQAGDYIFRSYPSDNFQGKFSADYLYNTMEKRRVAILAVQDDWGQGIKGVFKQQFTADGGTIVNEENFAPTATDLRTELTKIKNAHPDAIYFLSETQAGLLGLKQIKELGLTVPILGGDSWDDATIWADADSNGALFTVPRVNVPDSWRAEMKARGANVTICAPGAYNNVKIIADIMKKVGTDPTAIKNALYQVKDYPGINGPITLDQNGDLANAAFGVKQIENGTAVFINN